MSTQSISNEHSEFDIFSAISYTPHMNKYQKLDYLANFADELSEDQLWDIVNSIAPAQVVEIMPVMFACDLGREFQQASGIADWHREHGFLTASQCRWVVLITAQRWPTMNPHMRIRIQPSL